MPPAWSCGCWRVRSPFFPSHSTRRPRCRDAPGSRHQVNWWHALAGAPFFLAFPMIWARLSLTRPTPSLRTAARRVIWIIVCLSICGTMLVELPFLLHLAGTSEWQRDCNCQRGTIVGAPPRYLSDSRVRRENNDSLSCQRGSLSCCL